MTDKSENELAQEGEDRPTPQELAEFLKDPESQPRVKSYLDGNPDYHAMLLRICDLNQLAQDRIEAKAKEIYISRLATNGEGDDKTDWLAAEDQLCKEVELIEKAGYSKNSHGRNKVRI